MAWAEEECLRALVVTRAVEASWNQGETHKHVQAHLAARGHLPYMPQPLPSPCYLLPKILVVLTNADFIIFAVRIESKIWGLDIKNIVVWIAWVRAQLLISGTLLSLLEKASTISEPGRSDVVAVCLFRTMYAASKKASSAAHVCLRGRIPISHVKHILLIIHSLERETAVPYPTKHFVLSQCEMVWWMAGDFKLF